VYEIDQQGRLIEHRLGSDPDNSESFQCVISAGNWFAARLAPGGHYALVGCTVSPGFDFVDFELADREELLRLFPEHTEVIKELTMS
jgi:predicted cupin superfamily sugar epimerase